MHTSVSTATRAARAPTHRQWAVLAFMRRFFIEEDRLPTRTDIAAHFGWRSPNAADTHVNFLITKGFIEKRGIHLRFARTRKGSAALVKLSIEAAEATETGAA
ncbi:hypothetical protein LJR066_002815 [Acidovorax sp. LjRoot66]|uniref:LexA family protein n=1 Tax=Acidovorax sp. LjRoot66 TaxID=3342334 RepID=UPI003ECF628B